MKRAAWVLTGAVLVACGGPGARAPGARGSDLPGKFAVAMKADAIGDPRAAVRAHEDVLAAAIASDGDPWQVPALEASLDALATRSLGTFAEVADDAALARRTVEPVAATLEKLESDAHGPFARGLLARALTALRERDGDAARAAEARAATGCAREAVVVGPMSWAPVTAVSDEGPLDRSAARLEAAYETGSPFGGAAHPVVVRGRGCALDLVAESGRLGVREVVVDVRVDHAQTIGVTLRAHGAAVLRAAGTVVARRSFDLGDGDAPQFATVRVTSGALRLVARVGTAKDHDSVEIDAWGEDGRPLAASAPAVGSVAEARVLEAAPVVWPARARDELLLASAADVASGDPREAEDRLWSIATRADAPPDLALVYGEAVDAARDLSAATRAERARSAYERVLEVWPASWEAAAAHAVLAGVRRGRDAAGVEALRDLDALRDKMGGARPAVLDALEAVTATRERIFDRARASIERARGPLAGTALLADADATAPLTGEDLTVRQCDPARRARKDTLDCFDALRAAGDHGGAVKELTRLRALLDAPARWLPVELRDALAAGDDAAANHALGAMLPAERTLSALAALDASPEVRAHLLRAAAEAPDAPAALAPLLTAAGDEPIRDFEGVTERLVAQDRATPILPTAATAVLAHTERYAIDPSGVLRWTLFDVRRVSGTTDVEENAQASAPAVSGRTAMRALRRRIFKRDGRVLEPDQTPRASQQHADLSQLEQGDVVEAVYAGFALPGDTWDLGVDTPDLLPERVAVHSASVEIRVPRALRGSFWSHPLLGKPEERAEGDARVLTWHMSEHAARRFEDRVPKMDRSAGVSFSTAQWSDVARALRETLATLDDHDPEVAAWARAAAGADPKPSSALVEAISSAAGKALREADAATLSDYSTGVAPVQEQTARTFLAAHDGSRSWLVLRGLRELGVPADLRVAESDPYSADPTFPPHFGRFSHPLVVAHVEGRDIWVDADVAGPPLPAGRISPELRGRFALATDGTIAALPAEEGDHAGDEVDVRLALDARGDARGTLAVVLRGRSAQELAGALERIVGAERRRALRDVVLGWLPWANVDEVQLASSEGSWQVSLRAEVSVSGYAQQEGPHTWLLPGLDTLHWSYPRARVSGLGATFASRAGRQSALALSAAVLYHVHRRVELPKGATVSRMAGPIDLKGHLVDASRRISVSGSAIEDDFGLGVATGTVPASEYDAFAGVAHAADDGFLATTRVTMP